MTAPDLFVVLKILHVAGACVLLGTGTGIAFFFFVANRTGDVATIAAVGRIVALADAVFTATAAVLQPVTGVALALTAGYALTEPWLLASIALYVLVGACWLPVVWIQMRLRDLAAASADAGAPLPAAYHRLYRLWLALGVPGFGGTIAILALMLWRPPLW